MVQRVLPLIAFVLFVVSIVQAADDSFAGRWKLNPEKSVMHDQMKVVPAGPNRYAFNFGGGDEFVVVNGSDQPGLQGSTLAVKENGPGHWQVVRKQGGRMTISALWTLSPDGNSLRDDFTGFQPNGSSFTIHYIYQRLAGTSGFAGTWDSTSEKAGASEMDVRPQEGGGLAFTNQAQHSSKILRLDSKDYPSTDPNRPAGVTSSSRRMDARTLEFVEKRAGKIVDTQRIQLSADQRSLIMTIQPASGRKPDVLVFERE